MSEVRSTLIPAVINEQHRLASQSYGQFEPDVLFLHPTDRLTLFREIHALYKWANTPTPAEVAYEQFHGMDIHVSEKMTPGFFVVGVRVPIEKICIPGKPSGGTP